MEFLPGGDLLSLLSRYEDGLDEPSARFYLAELVEAIGAVHQLGYAHRDVRPENVLIDRTGHLKLAGFGAAAKLTADKTVPRSPSRALRAGRSEPGAPSRALRAGRSEPGAPSRALRAGRSRRSRRSRCLIAAEVLAAMGGGARGSYGPECDWWSLGVVAYEMIYARAPFTGATATETAHNILNFQRSLQPPEEPRASGPCAELLRGLLCGAAERLGAQGLRCHAFFSSVDWSRLRHAVPPFVPALHAEDDVSHFEEPAAPRRPSAARPGAPPAGFQGQDLPFLGWFFSRAPSAAAGPEPAAAPRGGGTRRTASGRAPPPPLAAHTRRLNAGGEPPDPPAALSVTVQHSGVCLLGLITPWRFLTSDQEERGGASRRFIACRLRLRGKKSERTYCYGYGMCVCVCV
ncbi:Citron Rho-interacting kinase [Liparis tanakae]|uniref:non-specific serine/threonine protein kinase n=1 Tax=Liparis tanakae TaxID=230148 RepID=A0A4Z2EBB8_9TELE|nr:Citron Rho-interacting kinase [Liparis tanakae]